MALPMVAILGLITGGIGALGNVISGVETRKGQKEHAKRIQQSMENLKNAVDQRQISTDQAIARYMDIINTAKGEAKQVMQQQIDLAVADQQGQLADLITDYNDQLKDYRETLTDEQEENRQSLIKVLDDYQESLRASGEAIKSEASKRRLLGAEATQAQTQKLAKQEGKVRQKALERQAQMEERFAKILSRTERSFARQKGLATTRTQRLIGQIRERGALGISQALSNLTLQGAMITEGLEKEKRDLTFQSFIQLEQMNNVAQALESAGTDVFGSKILGDVIKGFIGSGAIGPLTQALLPTEQRAPTPTPRQQFLSEEEYTKFLTGEQPLPQSQEDLTNMLLGRRELEKEEEARRQRLRLL
jgi:hypothetical protein